jgi:hypothetical protein
MPQGRGRDGSGSAPMEGEAGAPMAGGATGRRPPDRPALNRRDSSHSSGNVLLSLNGDGDHATSLPADGRDVMADLVPVGIEGEAAEEG